MPTSEPSSETQTTFEPKVKHARQTVVGSAQYFFAAALSLPTGLLTAGFLTRKLGPEVYGLLTIAAGITVFIEIIITSGFTRTTVKFIAETKGWQVPASGILQAQLLVCFIAVALLEILAPNIAFWLSTPELTPLIRLYALDIPIFAAGQIHQSILIGRDNFGQRALLPASFWLSRMVFVFWLVGMGFSIYGAILANIGASLTQLLVARIFVRPPLFIRSKLPFRRLGSYVFPLFLNTAARNLFKRSDLMFVKALSGIPQAAGFFGAAQNLTFAVDLFTTAFSPLLLSKLTKLAKQGREDLARTMARQPIRLVLCLLPFAAMTAGAATEIVIALYGDAFRAAGNLLALLIFAALAFTMLGISTSMLIAAGRPKLPFVMTVPFVPLALFSHFILVPKFGAIGAATVTTVLALLGAAVFVLAVCRIWRVSFPLSTLLRSLFVSGLAYELAAQWQTAGFLVLLKIPIMSLLLIVAFLFLGEFSAEEVKMVRDLLPWQTRTNKN